MSAIEIRAHLTGTVWKVEAQAGVLLHDRKIRGHILDLQDRGRSTDRAGLAPWGRSPCSWPSLVSERGAAARLARPSRQIGW